MAKASPARRKAARQAYERAQKSAPPGEGSRFKAVEESAAAGGARNPKAVAASIMWKKYGKAGGKRLAAKGKAKRSK